MTFDPDSSVPISDGIHANPAEGASPHAADTGMPDLLAELERSLAAREERIRALLDAAARRSIDLGSTVETVDSMRAEVIEWAHQTADEHSQLRISLERVAAERSGLINAIGRVDGYRKALDHACALADERVLTIRTLAEQLHQDQGKCDEQVRQALQASDAVHALHRQVESLLATNPLQTMRDHAEQLETLIGRASTQCEALTLASHEAGSSCAQLTESINRAVAAQDRLDRANEDAEDHTTEMMEAAEQFDDRAAILDERLARADEANRRLESIHSRLAEAFHPERIAALEERAARLTDLIGRCDELATGVDGLLDGVDRAKHELNARMAEAHTGRPQLEDLLGRLDSRIAEARTLCERLQETHAEVSSAGVQRRATAQAWAERMHQQSLALAEQIDAAEAAAERLEVLHNQAAHLARGDVSTSRATCDPGPWRNLPSALLDDQQAADLELEQLLILQKAQSSG